MNWKLYTSHRYKKNISIKKLKIICSLDVKYNKQSVFIAFKQNVFEYE